MQSLRVAKPLSARAFHGIAAYKYAVRILAGITVGVVAACNGGGYIADPNAGALAIGSTSPGPGATPVQLGTVLTPFTPLQLTGGAPPYTFSVNPPLPAGLRIDANSGVVSGTPSALLEPTTYTVTGKDARNATRSSSFSLTVISGLFTTLMAPTVTATLNAPVSIVPVTAGGGTGTRTFSIAPQTLPAGLSFNAGTGALVGTPSATLLPGTSFTVTASDDLGATSTKAFTLIVNVALVSSSTSGVPSPVVGTVGSTIATTAPVSAGGGSPPYTFTLSGGTLPPGLTFNPATGTVSGVATGPLALTTFVVTITDVAGATTSNTFQLIVNGPLSTTLAVPAVTTTNAAPMVPVTPVTANGGTAPLTFALSGGPLPSGLSFSASSGQLTGTPASVHAASAYTVTVSDAIGATSSRSFTLTVNPALVATQVIPSMSANVNAPIAPYAPVSASGGTPPYSFAVGGASLPAGMSVSAASGAISGTPTLPLATTTFTVTITDAAGATASATFQLTVNGFLSTTLNVASVAATSGASIAPVTPVTANGGIAPLSFAISGGTLPGGLNFSASTGQLSGTPGQALSATVFTVTVSDASAATSSKSFTLTVNPALVTTLAVPATTGTINTPMAAFAPVTAAGGTTPYAFTLSGGALPTGMSFSTATGTVSGTPTAALPATSFTVTVGDAAGATSAKSFQLTVTSGPLTTTLAIPIVVGTTNALMSVTPVTASGGTLPYAFVLSGGNLPPGLNFNNATGVLSGMPTSRLSSRNYTVTVTDFVGAQSSKTFEFVVVDPPSMPAESK